MGASSRRRSLSLPYVVEREAIAALCGEDEDEIEDARRDGFSDGYNEALQDVAEKGLGRTRKH